MPLSSFRRRFNRLFPFVCLLISNLTSIDAFTGFMPNDRCIVPISGGPPSKRSVHSVHLNDCEQGSLVWTNPAGPLLARFQLPFDQFDNPGKKSFQLCLNFPEQPNRVTIQKMINDNPMEVLSVHSSNASPSLECFPVQSTDRIQLFLKANDYARHGQPSTFGFYYALEEVLEEPTCGQCNERQFLEAFCSANFVFKGKLMRQAPEGNALEFSVELPLIRRPLLLTNIVSKNSGKLHQDNDRAFNTTTLVSKCPQGTVQGPILHTKFLVVSNAQFGFARLLCALELGTFEQIASTATPPCDLNLATRDS